MPVVVKGSCQLYKYFLYVTLMVKLSHYFCPCSRLIEVQHVVSVMAEWLVPQVQKAKNGARLRHGHSAKSFTMLWTYLIPIRVSGLHHIVLYPLQLSHFCKSINLLTISFQRVTIISLQSHSSQGKLASVYSEMLNFLSCHGKWLAPSVTVAFLSLLLILAGDVELNPGPGKGKEKATSGKHKVAVWTFIEV